MPRTLPWATEASGKSTPNRSIPTAKPAKAKSTRVRHDPNADLVDQDLNPTGAGPTYDRPQPAAAARARERSHSTSPPPAPPEVEFMRDIAHADDVKYLMVEDEFFSAAKAFTQHIHHAEYVRSKRLARSRGEETLQALARPVDRLTHQSARVRLKAEAAAGARSQRLGLEKVFGEDNGADSSEEEDDYMRDAQLAGLMTGETGSSKDLRGVLKPKSHTRAAAGFSQSPGSAARKRDALSHASKAHKGVTSGRAQRMFEEEDMSGEEEVGLGQFVASVNEDRSPVLAKSAQNMPAAKQASDIFRCFKRHDSDRAVARQVGNDRDDVSESNSARRSSTSGKTASEMHQVSKETKSVNEFERAVKLEEHGTEHSDDEWIGKRAVRAPKSSVLVRRRAAMDKRDKRSQGKAAEVDDIPTFMF